MQVFIVGVESPLSGGFEWFPLKESADAYFEKEKRYKTNDFIYKGSLEVDGNLDKEKITESIENYLSANDWENAPLKDKELLKNIQL